MQNNINNTFHDDLTTFIIEQLSKDNLLQKYGIVKRFPPDNELLKLDTLNLLKVFMHFKARLLQGKKTVYISADLQSSDLYRKYLTQVNCIKDMIESGSPVREYLSDKIENIIFTDKLFDDWGILHLHLFKQKERINNPEDNCLLYVIKDDKTVFFIDIQNHQSFFEKRLLEIIDSNITNAPGISDSLKPDNLERSTYKILREKGIGYSVNVNGKSFMTRMNSFQLDGLFCSRFIYLIDSLSSSVFKNYNAITKEMNKNIEVKVEPEFHIGFDTSNNDFILYDKISKTRIDVNFNELIQIKNMVKTNDFFL
jgi:hypothetical protein